MEVTVLVNGRTLQQSMQQQWPCVAPSPHPSPTCANWESSSHTMESWVVSRLRVYEHAYTHSLQRKPGKNVR